MLKCLAHRGSILGLHGFLFFVKDLNESYPSPWACIVCLLSSLGWCDALFCFVDSCSSLSWCGPSVLFCWVTGCSSYALSSFALFRRTVLLPCLLLRVSRRTILVFFFLLWLPCWCFQKLYSSFSLVMVSFEFKIHSRWRICFIRLWVSLFNWLGSWALLVHEFY